MLPVDKHAAPDERSRYEERDAHREGPQHLALHPGTLHPYSHRMSALDGPFPSAREPWQLQVADWRRRVAALYTTVREADDPEGGWRLWVETRRRLYAAHPASPVPAERRTAVTIEVFPYDPTLRVGAELEPVAPTPVAVPASGGTHAFTRFARARFALGGVEQALDLLWLESYGNGLFLPFADTTNGRTTYGGGRYLLDSVKGADLGIADGGLVLDFNFAYAPSCAWDDRWGCPLAPPGNRLAVRVEGGERTPPRQASA